MRRRCIFVKSHVCTNGWNAACCGVACLWWPLAVADARLTCARSLRRSYAELSRRMERAIAMTLLTSEPAFARRYKAGGYKAGRGASTSSSYASFGGAASSLSSFSRATRNTLCV